MAKYTNKIRIAEARGQIDRIVNLLRKETDSCDRYRLAGIRKFARVVVIDDKLWTTWTIPRSI